MADTSYLDWPFLELRHKALALSLERWAHEHIDDAPHARGQETDDACVALVRKLGAANWIRYAVGGRPGAAAPIPSTRAPSA
jgi:acyl-CoA dehydrogenase